MNILILNCGSSTLKFQVIDTDLEQIQTDSDRRLAKGMVERIGGQALLTLQAGTGKTVREATPVRDHRTAIERVVRWLLSPASGVPGIQSVADIHAVGHRVVHGAEKFTSSCVITDQVLAGIEEAIELAPLHNPANAKGIRAARELFGEGLPMVAVFDTAFHATMPPTSFLYAIPYQYYRRYRLRRYGFHGTSHRYVAHRYRQLTGKERDETNVITVHLGNGCSACAIRAGESFDTSMGLSPLEGLIMGTRAGDVDPAICEFLAHKEGLTIEEIARVLNKESGLLGVSGLTNDMRELLAEEAESGDRRVTLAVDMFAQRVRKYVGGYFASMGGADAVIFTGGIGENSPMVRQRICKGLEAMGLFLDPTLNDQAKGGWEGQISTPDARFKAFVIPTDEELLIARDTVRAIRNEPRRF